MSETIQKPELPVKGSPAVRKLYGELGMKFEAWALAKENERLPTPGTPRFFRLNYAWRVYVSSLWWRFLALEFEDEPDGCSYVLDLSRVWTCHLHDVMRRHGEKLGISKREGDDAYARLQALHSLAADPLWAMPIGLTRAGWHYVGVRLGSMWDSMTAGVRRWKKR